MKRTIIIAIALICCTLAFAQNNITEASYPEGNEALMSTIYRNVRYPKECMEQDIQGTVVVKVQIRKDGSIGKVTIVSSPHKQMSDEVVKSVKMLTKWTPATKNGKKVDSEVELPVTFRLSSEPAKKELAPVQCAEKAETIVSFVENGYPNEPEWYGAQALAWQKKVDENPKDQWAWRNLFRATYYYEQFADDFGDDQDQSRTADVIRKMEATLPDSYVLNLCKGRFCLATDSAARRGDNIPRAIELMPEDANAEDVDYLACRLWVTDPENPQLPELNKRTYESGHYPERVLRYNWNMLNSMQQGAIYFANGDVVTAPMKMLQDALGERTDVTVIPLSFLYVEKFRNALFKRLGIKPMKLDMNDYYQRDGDWGKQFYADMMMYLIRESKRPAYFSTDVLSHANLNKDSIYNEGILLKWSDHQYDNFGVAMHNVKEVYHLDYLAEPDLHPNKWKTSNMLDINHVTLLAELVPKLWKRGDKSEANRLYNILEKCLERYPENDMHKEFLQESMQNVKKSMTNGEAK